MFLTVPILLFLFLKTGGTASVSDSGCSVIINELQLALPAPNTPLEFIELRTNCSVPLSLSPYTLLLWHGNKKPEEEIKLHNRGQFSKTETTNCSSMNKEFLVIGGPGLPRGNDTQFCSFEEFGLDWWRNKDGYINKGRSRTNALVLYKDLSEANLTVNVTSLSNLTANRDKIVDLLFFSVSGAHGGKILNFLMPDYHVGPDPKNVYFRLEDTDGNSTKQVDKHSFGSCCEPNQVPGQWPMGFKWSMPTPGQDNNCNSSFKYALDSALTNIDRCNVTAVTNSFSPSNVTTVAPPNTSTTAPGQPTSSVGRTVGIVIGTCFAVVLVGLLVLVAVGRVKRRRAYGQVQSSQSGGICFGLHCLNSSDDTDRLVIHN